MPLPPSHRRLRRRGISYRGLVTVIVVAMVLPAIVGWSVWPGLSWNSQETGPMMHTVERGEFVHEITDRGNVESAENTEIKCEVKSKNMTGTQILWIVPEGTEVRGPAPPEKPEGDLLVELDSSSLENDRINQEIICKRSDAEYSQADAANKSALITQTEYLEGSYDQQERAIASEILVAQENHVRAKQYLGHSMKLDRKGYISALQLRADKFAVDKAKSDLDIADNKLEVLRKFTREKSLTQLQCDIDTAHAKLDAAKASRDLNQKLLDDIQKQLDKCKITAPQDGQVVYANVTGFRGNKEVLIAPGEMARERQVLIRLPNPEKMQVAARISESKIALVAPGMPAKIRLDAFNDAELEGEVKKVDEFPAPTGWFGSVVKEYETIVKIHGSPPGVILKPGLTAEVKILIERLPDVLQVPVQSVFEYGARYYCVVGEGRTWKAREVQIGSTNDKFVVIQEGVRENEPIVLNAAAYRDKAAGLPDQPSDNGRAAARSVAQRAGRAKPGRDHGDDALPEREAPAPSAVDLARRLMEQFDKNRDGRLTADEVPEQWRARLNGADANRDSFIDLVELNETLNRLPRRVEGTGSKPRVTQ